MLSLRSLVVLIPLAGCASTNDVLVELAPDVVSSLDGSVAVRATLLSDAKPQAGLPVSLTMEYTDRNGTAHPIAPIDGTSDDKGVFEATFTGLDWDGFGTITATVTDEGTVEGSASFSVLDRTPPVVTITPPANSQVRRGRTEIQVHVTDEIGVSQVFFDSSDGQSRGRSTIASGGADVTVTFDFDANDALVGQMITLYALGADLSGNQAAASPIVVTVIP